MRRGYAVPEEIDRIIEDVLIETSPLRRIASVVKVGSSDFKRLVNLKGADGDWVGETDVRPVTATPSLAEVVFSTGEVYAQPTATQWALDDISFDAERWLRNEIADVFAQMEGAAFIAGDGVKKPKGFLSVTMSTDGDDTRTFGQIQYIETDSSGVIGGDDLIDLVHSLKPRYRNNGWWVLNDATVALIRKLKDQNDQYLWAQGLRTGESDRLLGYPMLICEDMPDVVGGANVVAFGDFKRGYTVADRVTRMLRDPYTDKPNVKFYATKRVSGDVVNSEAIKVLRIKA